MLDSRLACEPAPELSRGPDYARTQAAVARAVELREQSKRLLAEARTIQRILANTRRGQRSRLAGRELPQPPGYAHLLARLETMPVIEQAKGIIMAQSRCGEAEAFDLLRRASQRSNVPVRELAMRIVAKAAAA